MSECAEALLSKVCVHELQENGELAPVVWGQRCPVFLISACSDILTLMNSSHMQCPSTVNGMTYGMANGMDRGILSWIYMESNKI